MSLKMVWANFTNPSLHLLEQPLIVAEGRQVLAVSTQKGWYAPRVPLDLGACLGEP